MSSVDLTTGRDLCDLSRGQLAATTTEGQSAASVHLSVNIRSDFGQHQWCVQDPEAMKMVSSKSRSCVSTREIIQIVSYFSARLIGFEIIFVLLSFLLILKFKFMHKVQLESLKKLFSKEKNDCLYYKYLDC